MLKSELKSLIKEVIFEIKEITQIHERLLKESTDWVILKSINCAIDSHNLTLIPVKKDGTLDIFNEIEPDSLKYDMLIKKLSSNDKRVVETLKKRNKIQIKPPEYLVKKLQNLLKTSNQIFDFAIITTNANPVKQDNAFSFEFFNSTDDIDYDNFDGEPICKVYKDKVELIKNKNT
jgi:pyridoxal/pyridoxine/pyridoxamine kinase